MGILEKIVQSIATGARQRRNTLTTQDELNLQYQAQVDVIGQLEDKVRRLFQSQSKIASSTTTGPLVKLQRDFERVQARAKALQGGVERLKREQKALQDQYNRSASASAASAAAQESLSSSGGGGAELDHYEQVQLQLQQDVSAIFLPAADYSRLSSTTDSFMRLETEPTNSEHSFPDPQYVSANSWFCLLDMLMICSSFAQRLAEEIMREREEEIRNINRGMHQVNEIYRDLASIVNSQQEQVDVIESQMEDAKVNAESGLDQVTKANEKYGSSNCTIS